MYSDNSSGLHPAGDDPPWGLVFNRMSASAHLRGGGAQNLFALELLAWFEGRGIPVVNGERALRLELSKLRQLALFGSLGLRTPRTLAVHDPRRAPDAARRLGFPLVVKPGTGGRGAGVRRFDTLEELEAALEGEEVGVGPGGTLLLQEYVSPAGGRIARVEFLEGEVLYAVRIRTEGEVELCPAELEAPGERVEPFTPPEGVGRAVAAIARAGGIDVGGVEYLEDLRSGERVFYDLNVLSNFVADAPALLGFDPWSRLVDFLERRLGEG